MKKTLTEELQRIHEITYGKQVVNEGFVNNLLNKIGIGENKDGKKIDDPSKADLVTPDVADFYKTIEDASKSGGLSQQSSGNYEYQKNVESMQIGLLLLGYELPKHGVDGLFGPETGAAVTKFKKDNSILNEDASSLRDDLDSLGYKEKGSELTSGGPVKDVLTDLVSDVLKSYKQTNPDVTVTLTSGNDRFHKTLSYVSKHTEGSAIDLTISPYNGKNASDFIKVLNTTKGKDSKFTYIDEYTNPSKSATGGHFHLQYGGASSTSGGGSSMTKASPEMLDKLLMMLKSKGVTSEQLKSYIDSVVLVGGMTDSSFYSKLLENLGAPVSEENLKFLYAWRQSEGSGGKFNPFNTTWDLPGSVSVNSHGVRSYKSIEDGMVATLKTLRKTTYSCIVNGLKNDIGADKIAKCESLKTWGTGDLVAQVVSGYNSGSSPKIKPLS